jgi:tripartite-type tricarboxylate transporter receptor subunit TctC
VIALVSGETQCQVAAISELIQHIKSNRVRALGVTSPERVVQLPDVPTIADTIPGYESSTWVSAFAPAGTPKAILDRLNAEFARAVKDADTTSKLAAQTLDPAHRTADELAQRMRADHDTIGKLFRQAGVKLD